MMTLNKRSIFFLSVLLIVFSRLPLFSQAMGICIDHEKHLLLGAADPRSADGLAAGF
jgi:hypothetical protein